MSAKQGKNAAADTPIMLRQELVLSGGSLAEPIIMPAADMECCSSQHTYVNLAKQSKWLCLLVTGSLPRNRPLSRSGLFDLLRKLVSDAWTSTGTADVSAPAEGLSALGLDDESDHLLKLKRDHRKRQLPGVQTWRAVSVPVHPHSAGSRTINVLLKSAQYAPSMELTADNLSWLRQYLREEIASASAPTVADPAGSTTSIATYADQKEPKVYDPEKEGIWWCSCTSVWRVSANCPGETTRVRRDVFVSREPTETFRDRVLERLEDAKQLKANLESGQCSPEKCSKPRKRILKEDMDIMRAAADARGSCEVSELHDAAAAPDQDGVSDQKDALVQAVVVHRPKRFRGPRGGSEADIEDGGVRVSRPRTQGTRNRVQRPSEDIASRWAMDDML